MQMAQPFAYSRRTLFWLCAYGIGDGIGDSVPHVHTGLLPTKPPNC